MRLLKQYGFLYGLFHCFFPVAGQPPAAVNRDYLRNPLAIPISLAANFGEVRKDHYHMGLDIRTQQRENLPVYAAAEGYVSRVSMERSGFGKAIYITHPAGYTTVYVHLNRFYDTLEQYVLQKQYRDEQWEQDFALSAGMFPVSKGQFIAWSGNTGASEGPHLHFEVRDTKSGNNLNPLLFNLGVSDQVAPVIYGLYWYDRRYSTYRGRPQPIALRRPSSGYATVQPVVKVGSPRISLGIRAEDKTTSSSYLFGIYSATVYLDDSLQFSFRLNNFSYNDTRYLNAGVDYTYWIARGLPIQHLSRLPGNQLPVFNTNGRNGILELEDTLPHQVLIEVTDVTGNVSSLPLQVQYTPLLQQNLFFTTPAHTLLPGRASDLQTENVRLHFSSLALYDTVDFVLGETAAAGWPHASVTAQLHHYRVPVHDAYQVSLRLSNPAWRMYSDKMVMVQQNPRYRAVQKPQAEGDWFSGSFRNLGTVQLLVDTVRPVIQTIGWRNGTRFPLNGIIRIRCSDNQGSIRLFRAELDGRWLRFTHSTSDYLYAFDEHCPLGEHELLVSVTDVAGNTALNHYRFTKEEQAANKSSRKPLHSPGKKKKYVNRNRRNKSSGIQRR